ncbi:MAG: bifunctional diaminohydroxyphosphoribosylaminopyrimidine deaminase/5-amino-6-(5-phosphoribosylamino)uracil reductase RibD [Candidatus Micrarchaeota archaeon]|nr:bifunctional diaminohydroxyphosphoribosylaminopyrimidine deaminase/5-amino-6-(5-phosphoribosylamino)uracil reductase RibD [Candidatus Micrarchaeota archaeon]
MSKNIKNNLKELDKKFMNEALKLAKKADPWPNPKVGAVIVKNGKIIAKGYHKKAGLAHAEVQAIKDAKKRYKNYKEILEGSTLYVNLEPCNHYGRTPPCTKAIVENKIKRVVFAIKDPNKTLAGDGETFLKKNNIIVKKGVLKTQAYKLNKKYFEIQKKTTRAKVILKLAISLDGKIATKELDSKWISSQNSRKEVQKLRKKVDAILIGQNTLKKDNPTLKVLNAKKQPLRVVACADLKNITGSENIFFDKNVLIAYNKADKKVLEKLQNKCSFFYTKAKNNKIELRSLLNYLEKNGYKKVLCEGGSELATSLIKENLADELILFYCPIVIGEEGLSMIRKLDIKKLSQAIRFKIKKIKRIGPDIMIVLKRMEKEKKEKNKRLKDLKK